MQEDRDAVRAAVYPGDQPLESVQLPKAQSLRVTHASGQLDDDSHLLSSNDGVDELHCGDRILRISVRTDLIGEILRDSRAADDDLCLLAQACLLRDSITSGILRIVVVM